MKIKLLLLFAISLFFIDIHAQIDLSEEVVVNDSYTTSNTSLTTLADIDGDGDPDVIASGSDLNWYENLDGLGSFSSKNKIAFNLNARAIQVADFDDDGDQDIIGLGYNNPIYVYENIDGKGTFELKENLGSSRNSTIFVSDMDKDGDLDIVSSYTTSSFPSERKIVFYENVDGKGDYSVEQTLIIYDNSRIIKALYITDIDGDTDMDVLTAFSNDDTISWFEHLDGNYNFSSEIVINTMVNGVLSIVAKDLDKDGDIDIVSASQEDNKIAWYENTDGQGSFSEQQIISSSMVGVQSIDLTDIDSDGDMDILSAASTPTSAFQASINNKVVWFENTNGNGNFGQEQIISTKAIGAKSAIADDINGDGYIDIISASKDDNKVAWYKNTTIENRFEDARIITRQVRFPSKVYAGDFDGDLDIDILSLSQHDAEIAWYENTDGNGLFGNQRIITEKIGTGNDVPTAFPIDIDGDGDLDIAAAERNELSWYENVDGKGNFGVQHIFSNVPGFPGITRASDIDKDGDMDVIFAYYVGNKIVWYENIDGKGAFGPEQIVNPSDGGNGSLVSMEISDIDGDGDIDVISSSFSSSEILWYENTDGKGAFSSHNFRARETGAVYPSDIDGDNDIDIVAVSKNGGGNDSVSWYENVDGKGTFSIEHNISDVRIHGNSIYTADVDNDGDMDVLTASGHSQTSGKLAWYENIDSKGTFSDQKIISEIERPSIGQYVRAADIDGDNDMDVLTAFGYAPSNSTGKISWFKSLANETLSVNDVVASNWFIYPNPTKGVLNINTNIIPKQVDIFSVLGRKVLSFYNTKEIDMTNLSNGLYLMRVSSKNNPITLKIIKK